MEQPPVLDSAVINELREIMGGDFDTLVASYIRDGGQRLQALSTPSRPATPKPSGSRRTASKAAAAIWVRCG